MGSKSRTVLRIRQRASQSNSLATMLHRPGSRQWSQASWAQGVGSEPKEPREFPGVVGGGHLITAVQRGVYFQRQRRQAKIKGLKLKCKQERHTGPSCPFPALSEKSEAPCRRDRGPNRAAGWAEHCHPHRETGRGSSAPTAWSGTPAWPSATNGPSQHSGVSPDAGQAYERLTK